MSIDDHPLRYSPITQAIEVIILRRSFENRVEGRSLEVTIEAAQAVIDLLTLTSTQGNSK